MSIVKIESPAEGGESKGGGTGMVIFGLLAAVAIYFGIKYFSKPKIEEEPQKQA